MPFRTPVPRRSSRRRTIALATTVAIGLFAVVSGPVSADPKPGAISAATSAEYRVLGPRTLEDRNAVGKTGAAINYSEHGILNITATAAEVKAITALGFTLEAVPAPPARGATDGVGTMAFPPADSNYHDYAELTAVINQVVSTTRRSPASPASAARTRVGTCPSSRSRTTSVRTKPNRRSCSTRSSTPVST